jgi:quercetin 2,3-dioxygenase
MIKIRRAAERGSADHGWLKANHTFSFADYHDPNFMGFRSLRVINEDYIAPGGGFPTHGHRDMEIVTYVTQGVLEHKDTLGNTAQIKPGMIQKMSAGSGIRHSEYNASLHETTRLLQIWIEPNEIGIPPNYSERNFESEISSQSLVLVASPSGENGSIKLYQDAKIFVGKTIKAATEVYSLGSHRHAWIQVVNGLLKVNGEILHSSDGAAISKEETLRLEVEKGSEFLLFDLA